MSFLTDLPSFGAFTKYSGGSIQNLCPPRYLCDHNTEPPDGQYIKTDETNILIRSLSKKKKVPPIQKPQEKQPQQPQQQQEVAAAPAASASYNKKDLKGKRPADDESTTTRLSSNMLDDFASKRLKTSQESVRKENEIDSLESMTKAQLVSLCKINGLPTNGNKEQLIERLKLAGVKRQ